MAAFRCDNVRAGILIEFVEIRLTRATPEEDVEKVYVARRQSHPRTRQANTMRIVTRTVSDLQSFIFCFGLPERVT